MCESCRMPERVGKPIEYSSKKTGRREYLGDIGVSEATTLIWY